MREGPAPPHGDRALSRHRPVLRSVCAAPRHDEADAGDAEQANERDGNAGIRAGAGQLVTFSALAARRLGLLGSRLRLLSGGLRLLDSRLRLLGSRLGLLGSRKLGEIARRRRRGIGLGNVF